MTQATPVQALSHLSRLAAKPGVRATLILSRANGTIVHSTGFNASISDPEDLSASLESVAEPENGDVEVTRSKGSAEDVARRVFDLVSAAEGLAHGLEAGTEEGMMGVEREHLAGTERSKSMEGRESTNDAVHLLRIRTRRGEAVVVPDSKYLLVVIHDGPKAL